MIDLSIHISKLLFEHDKVALPGLGFFVAQWQNAYQHPVSHEFVPKFKKITFVKDLKAQDVLLLNVLNSADAQQYIDEFVAHIQKELVSNNSFYFLQMGILKVHPKGNWVFEHQEDFNYDKSNFGLASFEQQPIQKQAAIVETMSQGSVSTSNKSKAWIVWLIAMVAIVTIAVVAYFNWDLIMPQPASPLVVEHVEEIVQEPQAAMETIEYSEELDTDSIGTEDSLVTDNASHLERQAAAEIIPEEVEPLPKEVRTIAAQNQYYIIAGCFRSEQKAEQYLADIKQNGYPNATIQGKTDQGLTRVCYAGFPNMTEAKVHLKEVIEKENKSLWIQRITD